MLTLSDIQNMPCDAARTSCRGCAADTYLQAATGRWFIAIGHPGFNNPANNRDGYATQAAAKAACARRAAKGVR